MTLSFLAGLGFRKRFAGSAALFYVAVASLIMPSVVVSLGIGALFEMLGIERTWWSSGLGAHLTWTLPFGLLIMFAVFNRFDKRFEEAARDLGASPYQTVRHVVLPIVLPSLVGVALFGFTLSYDELARSSQALGALNTLPLELQAMQTNATTPGDLRPGHADHRPVAGGDRHQPGRALLAAGAPGERRAPTPARAWCEPMTLAIRPMSRAEVELMLDWAAAEGWNPGLGDATPFHVSDPSGFLVGLLDDEPAAVISVVRYGDTFGFLGFYITRSAPSRQGLRAQALAGRSCPSRATHRRPRWGGGAAGQLSALRVRLCVAELPLRRDWSRVEVDPRPGGCARRSPSPRSNDLDRFLFPAPRSAFLAAWLAMPESQTLALVEGDTVTALGTRRRCRSGHKVGPLYAIDLVGAERVLRGLAAGAPGEELYLDVPGPNEAAMRLVQELGLTQRFETARMYKGPAPTLPLERIFGITTFELG